MRFGHNLIDGTFRRFIPMPGIPERLDLRLRSLAGRRFEKHVVRGFGIKWRVEINQTLSLVILSLRAQRLSLIEHILHAAISTSGSVPEAGGRTTSESKKSATGRGFCSSDC